jgi:hypothetical protein
MVCISWRSKANLDVPLQFPAASGHAEAWFSLNRAIVPDQRARQRREGSNAIRDACVILPR